MMFQTEQEFFDWMEETCQEHMLVCNCYKCGGLMLGKIHGAFWANLDPVERQQYPTPVYRRIMDRPICKICYGVYFKTLVTRLKEKVGEGT